MSKVFVTSDLHFFHINILRYTKRHKIWNSVEEMNEGIISNWNSVVNPEDKTYILGDISMGGKSKAPALAAILRRLNGHKYLVPGNHDNFILDSEECMNELTLLPHIAEIKIADETLPKRKNGRMSRQTIILCHYSMRVWPKNGQDAWHLFGHSHGNMDGLGLSFDIGLDGPHSNFRPMSYEQIRDVMAKREVVLLDHHNKDTSY